MEKLAQLKALRSIVKLEDRLEENKIACARKQLHEAALAKSKYSAMARDFLERGGQEGG